MNLISQYTPTIQKSFYLIFLVDTGNILYRIN